MAKNKEKDLVKQDPFMAKRIRESRKREAEYEASLDPRQFQEQHDAQPSHPPLQR